uniref:ATP-dependent Clp protease ATP-binding subunit clpA-like protein n=1 Tax=Halosiphon tomentosus TaxID=64927 RepID=UPI002E79E9F0|nr:ATP-dependent Clp protease ATP-binding subunit clpA-like protein [Halosiphon tomentosus]WAM63747.1 ATP-dependent Clp protease ATP-binding subunit clpA-like protein [Halosiphon tomentosus]
MFERFTERALQVIMMSQEESRRLGHNFVGTEQILLGLLGEGCSVTNNAVREYGITVRKVRIEVERLIGKGTGFVAIEIPFTPRAKKILEMSIKQSKELNHSYINTEHIFLALLNDTDGICSKVLQNLGANIPRIKTYVLNELDQNHESGTKVLATVGAGNQNQTKDLFLFDDLDRATLEAPNLLEYTTDLTESAERAKLDPVVGRQNEIERVIQILSRRRKNNPILIGEPGVGKTAVAEGLAQRIIQREVPTELHEHKVFVLDITLLLAGTKYRGEFEERLKRIVQELKEQKNIIIVIDEVHTLVGAGAAEGALDAANILKPALARGELQCIGATTIDEYRQHIEKDPALERRFQPVWVNEPSIEETITILKGLRLRYEQHHRLEITDEAITAAANLGAQYIADRFLPDKAIDLIDEGSARVRLVNYRLPRSVYILEKELRNILDNKDLAVREQRFEKATEIRDDELQLRAEMGAIIKVHEKRIPKGVIERLKVGSQDIASIVALWTGVPVTKITKDENTRLLELESVLHQRVIGQKEAVSAVARAVRRARVGMRNMKRPIASFFFSGPTGVGKTELTKTLASFFFGAEDSMVRLDMSEFMERHTVAKLIGSPPGYIGYNEGGQLTEAVRRKPYTVVLFDEVEKAHPDVFNLLLQILEDGRLTDSKGRVIDFKNTILIMTSNLGSKAIQNNETDSQGIGFGGEAGDTRKTKYAQLCNTVGESLKAFFKPEFLNRIDEIIVFEQLTKNNIKDIAVIMVNDLMERVKKEKEISLSLTPRMMELLIEEGFNPVYGARPLRRALVKLVEDKVSLEYLEYQKDQENDDPIDILVDVDKGKVKVSITKTVKKEEDEKPEEKATPKEVKKGHKISLPRYRTHPHEFVDGVHMGRGTGVPLTTAK